MQLTSLYIALLVFQHCIWNEAYSTLNSTSSVKASRNHEDINNSYTRPTRNNSTLPNYRISQRTFFRSFETSAQDYQSHNQRSLRRINNSHNQGYLSPNNSSHNKGYITANDSSHNQGYLSSNNSSHNQGYLSSNNSSKTQGYLRSQNPIYNFRTNIFSHSQSVLREERRSHAQGHFRHYNISHSQEYSREDKPSYHQRSLRHDRPGNNQRYLRSNKSSHNQGNSRHRNLAPNLRYSRRGNPSFHHPGHYRRHKPNRYQDFMQAYNAIISGKRKPAHNPAYYGPHKPGHGHGHFRRPRPNRYQAFVEEYNRMVRSMNNRGHGRQNKYSSGHRHGGKPRAIAPVKPYIGPARCMRVGDVVCNPTVGGDQRCNYGLCLLSYEASDLYKRPTLITIQTACPTGMGTLNGFCDYEVISKTSYFVRDRHPKLPHHGQRFYVEKTPCIVANAACL